MRTYDYMLSDDGGASDAWEQEILIPIGTLFLHEFGLYRVDHYRDEAGEVTRRKDWITTVYCNRVKSNNELKKDIENGKNNNNKRRT